MSLKEIYENDSKLTEITKPIFDIFDAENLEK